LGLEGKKCSSVQETDAMIKKIKIHLRMLKLISNKQSDPENSFRDSYRGHPCEPRATTPTVKADFYEGAIQKADTFVGVVKYHYMRCKRLPISIYILGEHVRIFHASSPAFGFSPRVTDPSALLA
jgi:hypothetical protein